MSRDIVIEPRETYRKIFQDKDLMRDVCEHIARGGSMTEFSKELGIDYSYLFSWIESDKERKEMWQSAMKARDEWTQEQILGELRNIGTMSIADAYDKNGEPLPLSEVPLQVKKSIQSIKRTVKTDDRGETVTTEIKFYDKIKAISLLGKELGMFQNKVEVSGKVSLEKLIGESFQGQENNE